ncbi:MAG TPA: ABC transporter permease, partial [Bryobacteraceae bacterium]|nr:ABC transporter permease [Bryobacteraceae bacterium]
MKFGAIIREAAAALNFNRQRSLLTMASLGWGVACFVILYAYGEGFGFALQSSFQAVGQDLILMFGGQTSAQAGGQRSGRQIRLESTDVDLIRENVPLVSAVSAETMIRNATVLRGVRQLNMSVRAVEPPYGKIRNMTLSDGRWINAEDYVDKQRVAILGAKAAHKLFGEIPPVGETITVNGIQFQIVG